MKSTSFTIAALRLSSLQIPFWSGQKLYLKLSLWMSLNLQDLSSIQFDCGARALGSIRSTNIKESRSGWDRQLCVMNKVCMNDVVILWMYQMWLTYFLAENSRMYILRVVSRLEFAIGYRCCFFGEIMRSMKHWEFRKQAFEVLPMQQSKLVGVSRLKSSLYFLM